MGYAGNPRVGRNQPTDVNYAGCGYTYSATRVGADAGARGRAGQPRPNLMYICHVRTHLTIAATIIS